MGETMLVFLKIWHILMWIAFVFFAASGLLLIIGHWVRAASIGDYKEKYDYINKYEIGRLTKSIGSLGLALAAFVNTTFPDIVATDIAWIFIRLFVSICIGALFYYIFSLFIKFAYPSRLYKKLKRLRYTPRKSPAGNKMKLLTEDEEDVHLDEGMQAEEEIFSVDYDVWVDQKTGYIKIEKYPGHLVASKCKTCGFQTMKVVREEIVSHPTQEMKGQLIKHYQCSYCKTRKRKIFKIAHIKPSDEPYELPKELHFREERKVMVKIEIKTSDGFNQVYEFSSLHEATKFMENMESERTLEVD
jgi:hypothetical protein